MTVPGTPAAREPYRLASGTGVPSGSRYIVAVAAAGAVSRKSRKRSRPSAICSVMNPPPPILPQHGFTTASA